MRRVTDDEHALTARVRTGDEAAWTALFARAEPSLRARIELKLPPALRRKVSVEDVLQEARLVAFRRIGEFEDRGDGAFAAWMARIAELKLLEMVRRYLATGKRRGAKEISRGARPDTAQFLGRGPSPSDVASAREQKARVSRALAGLRPDYRTVLTLVQFEQLTLAQAGERMGRSREAMKKLYGRALTKLAESLEID